MANIWDRIRREAPAGTVIPKPAARGPFVVKGIGVRDGQDALVYTIPSRKSCERPYEKKITRSELEAAYGQLFAAGEFSHRWFDRELPRCAAQGPCNFTTIGGLFQLLKLAEYAGRGVYRHI